ncbi:MAG: chloride channel protein, partial [Gammaproteobacteria bacterium]
MRNRLHHYLEHGRIRLSRADALGPLAVIGLLSGLLSGVVIVAFRLIVEDSQLWITSGAHSEQFENLGPWARFALPIVGAVALALLFRYLGRGQTTLGVANVMERMAYHQGHLTLRGFFLQFIGAASALVSGHSVGREGPHVYLGAAAGSLLGQRLGVPNNTIRVLVGCGTAAGIAASFNTPLAGVVFALEVVMLEYTVSSFVPIMLAAASATVVSNAVLGASPVFTVPPLSLASLDEIPLVIALGLVAGAVSALFIETLQRISLWGRSIRIERRLLLAGLCMGLAAAALPEVMGTGYDTVNDAIAGKLTVSLLLVLVVMKVMATSISVGLGVPGGLGRAEQRLEQGEGHDLGRTRALGTVPGDGGEASAP